MGIGNKEDRFNEKHRCAKCHVKNLELKAGRDEWMQSKQI